MGGQKVAVVGAGRLGSLVAIRMPGSYRKVVISRRKEDAVRVADECGAIASDQYSSVRGCQVILLALPGPSIGQVIADMEPHIERGALVVNMATDLSTAKLAESFPSLRMVAAKVMGHATEMTLGGKAVVVLDRVSGEDAERLEHLLSPLGNVLVSSEEKVTQANTAVIQEMAAAHRRLKERLTALGLPDDVAEVAIGTVGPGTLRALAQGDIGPFMQQVLESNTSK